jgi:hypothetical protein
MTYEWFNCAPDTYEPISGAIDLRSDRELRHLLDVAVTHLTAEPLHPVSRSRQAAARQAARDVEYLRGELERRACHI